MIPVNIAVTLIVKHVNIAVTLTVKSVNIAVTHTVLAIHVIKRWPANRDRNTCHNIILWRLRAGCITGWLAERVTTIDRFHYLSS